MVFVLVVFIKQLGFGLRVDIDTNLRCKQGLEHSSLNEKSQQWWWGNEYHRGNRKASASMLGSIRKVLS